MIPLTLSRYFAARFLIVVTAVFAGVFLLVVLIDYVEMMRRASDAPNASAWLVAKTSFFRVPQITERLLPFAVLVGGMTCYLNLSRRLELVVARSAGMSAWQFVTPALLVALELGALAGTVYNPVSAALREQSKRLEAELYGGKGSGVQQSGGGVWARQKSADTQVITGAADPFGDWPSTVWAMCWGASPCSRSMPPAGFGNASKPKARNWNPAIGGSIRRGFTRPGRRPESSRLIRCRPI